MKVLVLHNSISPYRLALFRTLVGRSAHTFSFVFTEKLSQNREWAADTRELDATILKTREISIGRKKLHLWWNLKEFSGYDVLVLNDHLDCPSLLGMMYGKLRNVPTLLWSANTINALNDLAPWQVSVKRRLGRLYSHCMTPGSEGRDYFRSLGVPDEKIHICNNVVDNDLFARARTVGEEEKAALREELGLKEPVLFYCGQFIARKGLDVLIKAINALDPAMEFSLLALGNGPLKDELHAAFSGSENRILSAPGFVQPSEIYKYYAISDVFVLPAHIDTWGMVVNEAMAAGVPVVVSTGAGAHADLVEHGVSGMVFEKGDAGQLAHCLTTTLSDGTLREKMIVEGDRILERYTLTHAADQFIEAAERTFSRK